MTGNEMAAEVQPHPASEPGESTLQVSVSALAAWLCVAGALVLALVGPARAIPPVLVAAASFYVSSRSGWRNVLRTAWHYNDDDSPGAVFLTHLYVVVCCAVLLLLVAQVPIWLWTPAPGY